MLVTELVGLLWAAGGLPVPLGGAWWDLVWWLVPPFVVFGPGVLWRLAPEFVDTVEGSWGFTRCAARRRRLVSRVRVAVAAYGVGLDEIDAAIR